MGVSKPVLGSEGRCKDRATGTQSIHTPPHTHIHMLINNQNAFKRNRFIYLFLGVCAGSSLLLGFSLVAASGGTLWCLSRVLTAVTSVVEPRL